MNWTICNSLLLLLYFPLAAPGRQKRQFSFNLGDLIRPNNNNQQRNGGIDLGGLLNTIVRPQQGQNQNKGGTTKRPNLLGSLAGQFINQAIQQTDVQLGFENGQVQVAVQPKQPTSVQEADCSGAIRSVSGRPSVGVRSGDPRCAGNSISTGCSEVNVNYGGNDIPGALSRQQNWAGCADRCRANSRCKFWTFRNSDGNCWLKTRLDARTNENDLVSGPRDCTGGGGGGSGSSGSSGCVTVGGGDTGASCVFPFIFKGKSYSGCTLEEAGDGIPWCSTLVDGQGEHVGGQGKWGHCPEQCTKDSGSAVSSSQNNKEVLPEGSIAASGLKRLPWFPKNGKLNLPLDTLGATNGNINAGDIKNRFLGLGLNQPNNGHGPCRVNGHLGQSGQIRHLHHCIQEPYFNFFTFLANIRLIQGRYIGVCCPDPVTTPAPTQAPTLAPTPGPTPGPTNGPVPQRVCGTDAKKVPSRRIVGGRPADPDEWPWLAALVRPGGRGSGQYCGATLISETHVLTAAHCLAPFQANDIRVKLGEYDFNESGETGDATFRVANMKMHENYNDVTYENDIAIIKLDRPATFSKSIWPICLPPSHETFENRRAFVIGWGTIYFGGPTSPTLQEVNVRVWDQDTCKNNYNKLGKNVTQDMLCAGERFRDSCQGDSGGPLNCQNQKTKQWELCGVVSWGAKCAEPEFPGVYTRVTKYLDWIQNNSI